MRKFRVFALDVWGNATEGFEVNDRTQVGTIETSDEPSDSEVWCALLEADIAKGKLSQASFSWADETLLHIDDALNGKPTFQLECD